MRAIKRCVLDAYPVQRSLYDSILFRMHGPAEFMPRSRSYIVLLSYAAYLKAVRKIPGRAVITRGKYPFIFHDDGAYLISQARRALSNNAGKFHEIFIYSGTHQGLIYSK